MEITQEFLSALGVVQDFVAVISLSVVLFVIRGYKVRNKVLAVIMPLLTVVLSYLNNFTLYNLIYNDYANATYVDGSDPLIVAYDSASSIAALGSILLTIIIPLIIMRVNKKFSSAVIVGAFFGVTQIPITIASLLTADNAADYYDPKSELTEEIIIITVFIIIAALLLFVKRSDKMNTIDNVLHSVPKGLYPLVVFFCYAPYFTLFTDSAFAKKIILAIAFSGIIFVIGYFAYKIFALGLSQNEILRRFDDQQTGYEKMLKSDQQLREFRHDYKNHMMVVTALLNAGKTEEASEYLDKIKVKSGIAGRQFSTGNFIVDAILNNKNSLAEEFAIHLKFEGAVPESGIANADLCTVVSNLLDNAIEGTKRYEGNRYVTVESSVRNGFLAIHIANPVNAKVEIKNNRIKTTKQDSRNHGIGLKNVQRTAEKYGGKMFLDCSDTEFTADVNMRLEH